MSDGISSMWDEIGEAAYERKRQRFQAASASHFRLVEQALEDLERFIHTDPTLTKTQHSMIDHAWKCLKNCFEPK